jgi:hypothetical protein
LVSASSPVPVRFLKSVSSRFSPSVCLEINCSENENEESKLKGLYGWRFLGFTRAVDC